MVCRSITSAKPGGRRQLVHLTGAFCLGLVGVAMRAGAAWASTAATLTEGSAQGSPWSFTLGTGAPVSIPTLNEWGRILLAMFIAAIAFKYLRRHPGPAALALTFLVFLWTGIVLGAPERWPFSTASHDPTALIVGTISTGHGSSTRALTMRYPLSPAAGQAAVLVITQLAPVAGVDVTGTTLHYLRPETAVFGKPWPVPRGERPTVAIAGRRPYR